MIRPRLHTIARHRVLGMVLAIAGVVAVPSAHAQEPDDALGRLLEKVGEPKKEADKPGPTAPGPAKPPEPEKKPAAPEPGKPGDAKPGDVPPRPAPGSGDVAPKDQDLDKILEGLGQSTDKPATDDPKGGGGGKPEQPMPPMPGDGPPRPSTLDDKDKDIDDILAGIEGKKKPQPKKSGGQGGGQPGPPGQGGDEEGGPLGQVIKKMREVEERLGQPDTGEETRRRQGEIVKNLDTLIEQLKNAPNGQGGMKMIRQGKQPGQPKPGQSGQQPGAMAQGTSPTRPADPRQPPGVLDGIKAVWGQLPSQMRDGMDNVLNENPLPTKAELIRLYYLSLGKKSTAREE